jgi:hypothetical protein
MRTLQMVAVGVLLTAVLLRIVLLVRPPDLAAGDLEGGADVPSTTLKFVGP